LSSRYGMVVVQMEWVHLDRVAVRGAGEVAGSSTEIDEGVEALVHPRIEALVAPDHHGEPLVAELVREHPMELVARGTIRSESEHRVFHALDRTFDSRGLRIGIAVPLLAEVLDRLPGHAVGLGPAGCLRTVEGLDEDALVVAGIPAQHRPGGKREVPYAVRGKLPGELAGAAGTGAFRIAGFVLGDDRDRLGRGPCNGESFRLSGLKHLLRFAERAGGRHEVAGGQRQSDVEAAVLQVELAGT